MIFNKPDREQLIALTGVYQACQLVDKLARTGNAANDNLDVSIASLFVQNPETTEDVFGGLQNLQHAFGDMEKTLKSGTSSQSGEILRYMMGVQFLATKLQKQSDMLDHIGKRLTEIERQKTHFSTLHESVIHSLADLYVDTIGTFQRRIQVNGVAENLQQPLVASKIRCLLFASIRATILWYQLGGRKIQLLFYRKDMQRILQQLRNEL